jgi:TatA/E family protein of Tat protein translocase
MHYPLFFEFIGTSEMLVVLFVALLMFGPRKLPEMGRSLGEALHYFRNASNDFKRTWEMETLTQPALTQPALTQPVLTQSIETAALYMPAEPKTPTASAAAEAEINAS